MKIKKLLILFLTAAFFVSLKTWADTIDMPNPNTSGIGGVAAQAKKSLSNVALLITAGAYVAGMGFAVGAIAKFMAHKTNPTQVPISQPIALLFVAIALMFAPSVFKSTGETLFYNGQVGGISGVTSFGASTKPSPPPGQTK